MAGFKKNEVKYDLASYPHYVIMGERKVGKTTFFYNLVEYLYGSQEYGVLISCGEEVGFKALDGIQAEEALVWSKEPDPEIEDDDRGFVEIVDDLVENRNTTYKKVKLVAIDTADEWISIGIKQVFKEHKDKYKEKCTSLNDALGGFNRGKDRLKFLIDEQLARLNRAGYAPFILAHTKEKNKEDVLTDKKYVQITNNLTDDLYGIIADKAQMIVNIVKEHQIKGGDKKDTYGNLIAGSLIETKRMMYFRDNGLVDAGGRFTGLPEKLELSAENFMKAFKTGVDNARKDKLTNEQIEQAKQKEQEEQEKQRQRLINNENVGDSEKKDSLIDAIKTIIQTKVKANNELATTVNEKMKELGLTLKELPNATLQTLKDFALWLKDL